MWLHYVWYRIKIRYQINTVPTPTVAWTTAWRIQRGGGGTITTSTKSKYRATDTHAHTAPLAGAVGLAAQGPAPASLASGEGRMVSRASSIGRALGACWWASCSSRSPEWFASSAGAQRDAADGGRDGGGAVGRGALGRGALGRGAQGVKGQEHGGWGGR